MMIYDPTVKLKNMLKPQNKLHYMSKYSLMEQYHTTDPDVNSISVDSTLQLIVIINIQ